MNEGQEGQIVDPENQPEGDQLEGGEQTLPEGPDLAALSEKISGLGIEGLTLENIADRFKETHTGFRNLQNENAEYKKKQDAVDRFMPVIERATEDPAYDEALFRATQEYIESAPGPFSGVDPEIRQTLRRTFDPIAQTVHQQGKELAEMRLEKNLNRLESSINSEFDNFVDENVKKEVVKECLRTGNMQDVDGAFWRLYGRSLTSKARSAGAENTKKTIQGKAESTKFIMPAEGVSASEGALPDVNSMTPEQYEKYIDDVMDYYDKNPKKADEIAASLLNI